MTVATLLLVAVAGAHGLAAGACLDHSVRQLPGTPPHRGPVCPSSARLPQHRDFATVPLPRGISLRQGDEYSTGYTMQDTVDGFRTLLVLDDDASRMALVRQFAARRGLRTIEMGGSPQSHPELPERSLDLVVLDADAPGGRSTCVRLRTRNVRAPIILLVNDRHDLNARLLIDAGADDMISKPVDAGVLAGRLDAHLDRDVRRVVATDLLRSADLTLDLLERRLFEGGSELPLTAVEFDVLAVLASRPGQVMSSRELLRQVWAYQQDEDPELVTALVERLQRVVEDDLARPRLVQVIAGLGYRFNG